MWSEDWSPCQRKIKSRAIENHKRAEIHHTKAKNEVQNQERDGETIEVVHCIRSRSV